MAQRASTKKRSTRRKSRQSTKKSFNIGKFTLGLFILIVLGYAALAIWEGKLVIDEVSQFEMPEFFDEEVGDTPPQPNDGTKTNDNPAVSSSDSSSTEDKLDRFENFNTESFDLYFTKAFDFGWPDYTTAEAIIERPYYTLRYNEIHEQAMWVAYALNADSLRQEPLEIRPDYRLDPRVRTGSATPADYQGSGYVMGQLAPVEDFNYDEFALSQSYYMSNISPQLPAFNEGLWLELQRQTRKWTLENDQLQVVSGPILSQELPAIGKNKVSVPRSFYKIILSIQQANIKAIAFLVPNEASDLPLYQYEISIDRIEEFTGLDFFPSLPDDLEAYLESGYTAKQWRY